MNFLNLQRGEASELEKGAVKAVQDLYDVVRHDFLSVNMRSVKLITLCFCVVNISFDFQLNAFLGFFRDTYDTWNLLSKARTEGRLFSKLKWPKDAELV